jgi:hypothetical protein
MKLWHCPLPAKALLVLLGSLEDEIVSNHPSAFVAECGAFVNGTIHFRFGETQSHFSVPKPVAE